MSEWFMPITVGLDIGSTTTKVALLDDSTLVASEVAATGASCRKTAARLLENALRASGRTPDDIAHTVATGYGRRLVEDADQVISELTANAAGARYLAGDTLIRTVIDIGGQDSKVIALDEDGLMANFAMNDKCAAGTGRFLEVISRVLEIDLEDLGHVSLRALDALQINSVCTVFAETEVISLLAQGKEVAEIVAGVHASIARRVAQLARSVGVEEPVFFDGGPAQNIGLKVALERELDVPLIVPPCPQIATAIGAALIGQRRLAEV